MVDQVNAEISMHNASRTGLEANRIPVGALNTLEVVGLGLVININRFRKDDKRISNKQMSNVACKAFINAFSKEQLQVFIVHGQIDIVVRIKHGIASPDVRIDGAVPGFLQPELSSTAIVIRQAPLIRCPVIH